MSKPIAYTSKPVAYLRRSNAATTNHGGRISFDVQQRDVMELAARRGDPEPELVVEWGVSGAAAAGAFGGTGRGGRRRAYYVLRDRIAAGEVSALYAYSLSRLARSTRELLELAEVCTAAGVPIRLAKEGDIDGTTPSGRLYLTVLAAVATFEAEVAAERSRDRNEAMRERGAHLGRAPYGYRIDRETGALVEDPETIAVATRVVELYRESGSPAKVAQELNREGVVSPQGRFWRDGTVRRILRRTPGAGYAPTIQGSRALPASTFARLLRCRCGGTMSPARKTVKLVTTGESKEFVSYVCTRERDDKSHGKPRSIPESRVLAAAMKEAAHLATPNLVELARQADERRADIEARRSRIVDALEAGVIVRAEAQPRLDRLARELEAFDAQVQVTDVPAIDWSAEPEDLNAALRTLWDRIELGPDNEVVSFAWRVPEWRAA